jgi:thiol-disulfide isomerase/thioredoxin
MKTLTKLAITLIVARGTCVALGALRPQESQEFDGQQATPFELKASNGAALNLEDFHGRPVMIEFFATWCPPCRDQLTQLAKLHDKYADKGLGILALAVDPFETPETAKDIGPLAIKMKLPFPVGAATGELAQDYHYKGFPTTIVLDTEGKIVRTFYGYHSMETFEPLVHSLLTQ